jgi:hypothetical protein
MSVLIWPQSQLDDRPPCFALSVEGNGSPRPLEVGHRADAVAGRRAGGGAMPTTLALGPAPAAGGPGGQGQKTCLGPRSPKKLHPRVARRFRD